MSALPAEYIDGSQRVKAVEIPVSLPTLPTFRIEDVSGSADAESDSYPVTEAPVGGFRYPDWFGRLLVRMFLGNLILGVIAVCLMAFETGLFLTRLASKGYVDPTLFRGLTTWDTQLAFALLVYFVIVVPATIAVLFVAAAHLRKRNGRYREVADAHYAQRDRAKTVAVLTAYNDEASIGLAVQEFHQVRSIDQIVVIDNNSSDRTASIAQAAGATVVRETRQGYGYACMRGLRYALENTTANQIVLAEGDMTFYADDVDKMLPYLDESDLVLGTRTTAVLTRDNSQMDWFMAWGNMFLAHLIRLRYWDPVFFGQTRLTDVGCTFRAIRRKALQRIMDKMTVGGNYFSPHMILLALQAHLRVIEVPIRFRERVGVSKGAGGSRKRALGIGLQMLREITFH